MIEQKIQKLLSKLPHAPGVYFFYGPQKALLYIGKATDLRSRVSSYFRQPTGSYQRLIEAFIDQVSDIKWQATDSTLEALILESNLISQAQPKYNVEAKDDKTLLGIYITDENFPRVFPARITNKKLPNGEFFGPYTYSQKVRQALKILRRIFPWCNENHTLRQDQGKSGRPCLYYHLNLCPGTCANAIEQKDYQQIIKNLKLFLKGRKKQLIRETNKHMIQAAKAHNFEQAARLRDQLSALEHIHDIALQLHDDLAQLTRQQPWRLRIEGYDISNLSGQWAVGSMVTFIDGRPAKDFYRRFKIKTVQGVDDVGMMKEVIKRRLTHALGLVNSHTAARNSQQIQNSNNLSSKRFEFENSTLDIVSDFACPPKPRQRRGFRISDFKDDWPLPDLMLIDGGLGHYTAVQGILDKDKVPIPLLAIAKGQKRQKSDLYGGDLIVKKYRSLLPILIQIRDEAHRFAIAHHRNLRSKFI